LGEPTFSTESAHSCRWRQAEISRGYVKTLQNTFDSRDRNENRASTQISGLLITQQQQILRSNADSKTAHAFLHTLGQ
jgi:cytochrome oxidase assembly protein ShyY1